VLHIQQLKPHIVVTYNGSDSPDLPRSPPIFPISPPSPHIYPYLPLSSPYLPHLPLSPPISPYLPISPELTRAHPSAGDNFDFPYVKKRCEVHAIDLNAEIGFDTSAAGDG